jgi:hypothetical protein
LFFDRTMGGYSYLPLLFGLMISDFILLKALPKTFDFAELLLFGLVMFTLKAFDFPEKRLLIILYFLKTCDFVLLFGDHAQGGFSSRCFLLATGGFRSSRCFLLATGGFRSSRCFLLATGGFRSSRYFFTLLTGGFRSSSCFTLATGEFSSCFFTLATGGFGSSRYFFTLATGGLPTSNWQGWLSSLATPIDDDTLPN